MFEQQPSLMTHSPFDICRRINSYSPMPELCLDDYCFQGDSTITQLSFDEIFSNPYSYTPTPYDAGDTIIDSLSQDSCDTSEKQTQKYELELDVHFDFSCFDNKTIIIPDLTVELPQDSTTYSSTQQQDKPIETPSSIAQPLQKTIQQTSFKKTPYHRQVQPGSNISVLTKFILTYQFEDTIQVELQCVLFQDNKTLKTFKAVQASDLLSIVIRNHKNTARFIKEFKDTKQKVRHGNILYCTIEGVDRIVTKLQKKVDFQHKLVKPCFRFIEHYLNWCKKVLINDLS